MRNADSRCIFLHILPARARGAIDIHLDVRRVDLYFCIIHGYLREHFDQGERSMPAVRGIEGREAHETMNALFRTEVAKGILTVDRDGHALDPGLLALGYVEDLGLISLCLCPAQI